MKLLLIEVVGLVVNDLIQTRNGWPDKIPLVETLGNVVISVRLSVPSGI